jgi:transposase-like protein
MSNHHAAFQSDSLSTNEERRYKPIITLRHEGQSIWKISRFLKVSSSAVVKTIKRYDENCLS